jgi:hypothetical protein
MQDALNQAGRAFESSQEPEVRSLLPRISAYQARMEPLAYDCIGCKKCWGADATIELANHFDDVKLDPCGEAAMSTPRLLLLRIDTRAHQR